MSSGLSGRERMEQRRRDFIGLIKKAGGTPEIKPFAMPGRPGRVQEGWPVSLKGAQSGDVFIDAIHAMAGKTFALKIDLSQSTITDEQLAALDENMVLRGTVVLDLGDTAITDAGIDQVERVRALTELNLAGAQVTKAAVERLKQRQSSSPDTPPIFRKSPHSHDVEFRERHPFPHRDRRRIGDGGEARHRHREPAQSPASCHILCIVSPTSVCG